MRIGRGIEIPPSAAWEGGKAMQVLSKGYVHYAVGAGRGSLLPSSAHGAMQGWLASLAVADSSFSTWTSSQLSRQRKGAAIPRAALGNLL